MCAITDLSSLGETSQVTYFELTLINSLCTFWIWDNGEYQYTKVQAEFKRYGTGCQQRDIEIKMLKSSIYIEIRNHATGLGESLEKEEERSED